MTARSIIAGSLAAVLGLLTLVLVIVLPSSEDDCGPTAPRSTGSVGECAPTGSPVEAGLQPDTLRVLRCLVAHFGMHDLSGVREDPYPDHPSGRALDFMVGADAAGQRDGDAVVAYLQDNADAFGIEYLIWRQRIWRDGQWAPMADRGSPTANHMDHVHITTKGNSGQADRVELAGNADKVLPPLGAPVDEAGGIRGSAARKYPLAAGSYTLTSGFGPRWGTTHLGQDFAAAAGTPIFAAADGKVVAAGPASGFGNWIVVDHVDDKGKKFSTVYGHMESTGIHVRVGDGVAAGQHIGDVGNAGQSTGAHLHFEVVPGGRFTGGQQIDPMPWLGGAEMPDGGRVSTDPRCQQGFGTPGGNLASGKLPAELEPWYRRAGSLCPEITASLLAAQGQAETGFRRGLTSPAGAQGLGQFLPSTATTAAPDGQPYVIDADGNGVASVWDDGDAIVGQGRYMCALAAKVEGWKQQGRVSGDTAALALAAYNAGEGAVLASGGMPNQAPGHITETHPYVAKILAAEPGFRSLGSSGRFVPDGGSELSNQVVAAGRQWLGTPYAFGGGGPQGPTGGGFDDPGFTAAAVFAASGGTISLPRTPEQQWKVGAEVPMNEAQPGDLVFGDWGAAGPGHVGIYLGNGLMMHAPGQGDSVREAPVASDMKARRMS